MMNGRANGLRYLRWGIGAIRFGCRKNSTAEKMLGMPQNPQRQVHALLGGVELPKPTLSRTKKLKQ